VYIKISPVGCGDDCVLLRNLKLYNTVCTVYDCRYGGKIAVRNLCVVCVMYAQWVGWFARPGMLLVDSRAGYV